MKLYLSWKPELGACPECGYEQNFAQTATCRNCDYHAGSDMSAQWTEFVEKIDAEMPSGLDIAFAHESEGDGYWLTLSCSLGRGHDNDEQILREWIASVGTAEEGEIRAALAGCANPIDQKMDVDDIERLLDGFREACAPEWVKGEQYAAWQKEISVAEAALAAAQTGGEVWRGEDNDGNFWWF